MLLGLCTTPDQAPALRAAGFDFLETGARFLPDAPLPDLPLLAANSLIPGSLKITGPSADPVRLTDYLYGLFTRAAALRIKTLVLGSGIARRIDAGVDPLLARDQILDFCRIAADLAGDLGLTLALEPLHKGECNVINTLSQAMDYARAVGHPNFRCLVDSFHFWQENEPLDNLRVAVEEGWIAHVHVADRARRTPPRDPATEPDYLEFLGVLKRSGYDATFSVEAAPFDIATDAAPASAFLRRLWQSA